MISDFISQTVSRYNPYMQGLDPHMINDKERNQFYDKLISNVVKDKICADIGMGSGLLTMIALQHGAKHVYAYEAHSATYDMGKAMLEEMGYGDRVTFINKRYDDLTAHEHSDKIEIILHELLMRAIWGEGLFDIHRLNKHTKANIYPNKVKCQIMCNVGYDYTMFGNTPDIDIDVGLDYLKSFSDTWYDLGSSEEYFSIWPENKAYDRKLILDKFTDVKGEYNFNLNIDNIPEFIDVEIELPDNCLITTMCSINGFYMIREHSNWRPDKIVSVTTGGTKIFRHRVSDGNWWLE